MLKLDKHISGLNGSSYGASIPVKPFNAPDLAFAYSPLTSRFSHSSNGVETKI